VAIDQVVDSILPFVCIHVPTHLLGFPSLKIEHENDDTKEK
jgi:hypothetical protein